MKPWLSTYIVYEVDIYNCEKGSPATTQEMSKNTSCLTNHAWLAALRHIPHIPQILSDENMGMHWTVEHPGDRAGWGSRGNMEMESHLHLWHVAWWMSQTPAGPPEPDGAFVFLQGQKGATFSSLAPLLPRAVPVTPVLLICTVEEKTCLL